MAGSGHNSHELSADPRAARTRAVLRQALMQLLQRSGWGGITTSDICRRAGVARSSFYEHYTGKADLLDEIFAEQMKDILPSHRVDDPFGTLDWLCDHVSGAAEFFTRAMAGERDDALLPRFRAALIRKLEEELSARGIADPGPRAAFLIGGSMEYLVTAQGEEARRTLQVMAKRIVA